MNAVVESPSETAIAEYSTTAAVLAELRSRLADVAYEVSTSKGLEIAKKDRAEVRSLRTALEAKRVELKAPALERSRLIDAEAKSLTAELLALEKPIDDQIKAEERRKEAEKAAKEEAGRAVAAAVQVRIDGVRNFILLPAGAKSASIKAAIEDLTAIEVSLEAFGDRAGEVVLIKTQTLNNLNDLLDGALEFEAEQERVAEERAELARQRAEQEARDAEERARVTAEQKAEADRLAAERKKFEQEQVAARAEAQKREDADRARRDEEDRKAREARAAEDKRLADARAALEAEQRAIREAEEAKAAAARKEAQDKVDAEAAAERKRLDDEAAAIRVEQQRKGEERERQEAARQKVRDAAPALLASLEGLVSEPQPLGIDRATYQAALAAITLATGEEA